MIEIARSLRVIAGGLAAGAIGVTALAGGTAWAEPARPAPPAPGTVAPAPQNTPAVPAQGSTRVLASPPASNPIAAPPAATARRSRENSSPSKSSKELLNKLLA